MGDGNGTGSGAGEEGKRDEEQVGRFVERLALNLSEAGWPRMPARVFAGILVAPDGRRTAAELVELLHVSPAAISGAVRYLMQVGLITREREPGQRRDYYRVYDDLWYEAIVRSDQRLLRLEASLQDGIQVLGAGTAAGARLDETRRFFEFVRGELPHLIGKWRAQRAAPHRGPAD